MGVGGGARNVQRAHIYAICAFSILFDLFFTITDWDEANLRCRLISAFARPCISPVNIFWFQAGIAIVATVWYSSDFMTDAVLKLTSVSHWFSNKPGDNEIIRNNWHTWRWYHLPIFTSPLRVGRKWRQEGRRRGRGRKSGERQQMLPCQKSALQHRSLFIQIRLGTFPAIIAGQHAEECDISHSTKLAALEAGGEY